MKKLNLITSTVDSRLHYIIQELHEQFLGNTDRRPHVAYGPSIRLFREVNQQVRSRAGDSIQSTSVHQAEYRNLVTNFRGIDEWHPVFRRTSPWSLWVDTPR